MDVTLKELPSWPPFSEDRPVTPSPGPARPSAGPLGAGTCMAAHATVSPASSLYRRFYSFFLGGGGESFSVLPILAHPDLVLSYYFKPWAFTMDP